MDLFSFAVVVFCTASLDQWTVVFHVCFIVKALSQLTLFMYVDVEVTLFVKI